MQSRTMHEIDAITGLIGNMATYAHTIAGDLEQDYLGEDGMPDCERLLVGYARAKVYAQITCDYLSQIREGIRKIDKLILEDCKKERVTA